VRIWPCSADFVGSREALSLQRVYAAGALRCFFDNTRKRGLAFANAEKLKLLLQRKLTFVNVTAPPGRSTVTQLGVTCPLTSAATAAPFLNLPVLQQQLAGYALQLRHLPRAIKCLLKRGPFLSRKPERD
jgi:hypothetical protein